jgi:hypothetical protein
MVEKVPLNVKINPVMLKRITSRTHRISINDVKDYDLQIYKSLKYLIRQENCDLEAMP